MGATLVRIEKGSWRGSSKLQPPSNREMVEICIANAEEAARNYAKARADYEHFPPGDARLEAAKTRMDRFAAEQAHWRNYAQWYRGELAKDEAVEATALEAEDRARSRVVGADDDDEDEPLSPWADIGAGVAR